MIAENKQMRSPYTLSVPEFLSLNATQQAPPTLQDRGDTYTTLSNEGTTKSRQGTHVSKTPRSFRRVMGS